MNNLDLNQSFGGGGRRYFLCPPPEYAHGWKLNLLWKATAFVMTLLVDNFDKKSQDISDIKGLERAMA